ncbi:NAD(P)-binding domain-containing protein [Flavobacterium cupreum]|nr:NAD(P)-binding domain-containing protein [Flavobacterium cupreum]
MKVGIIGVCSITLDYADKAARSGHEVLISHIRNNSCFKEVVQRIGSNAKLVSVNEAAKSDIIILFIPREDIDALMHDLPDMTGKIVLHTNNLILNLDVPAEKTGIKSSSETIASLLPTAHVVKIFNVLELHKQNQNKYEIFDTAADQEIKDRVIGFLESLNFIRPDVSEL